mgnify:FL=1
MIDTHTHIYLEEFDEDRVEVVRRAREAGVERVILPNVDFDTVQAMHATNDLFPGYCRMAMGLHPTSVEADYRERLGQVRELLFSGEYCAVGEIGLDLYWDKTYAEEQKEAFVMQTGWAAESGLPVIIHCREAFDYIYDILKPYKTSSLRGIFHSFTGTREEAFRMLEFSNFFIGINGVVTFKKSGLPEVLQNIPLERIVLETDSPYLTPVPNRGKRNESANVKDTLLKVAEIYGNSPEEIGRITSENALKVFGMLK